MIVPDTGGGFGTKVFFFYPDEVLVPLARSSSAGRSSSSRTAWSTSSGRPTSGTQIHELSWPRRKTAIVIGIRDTFLHDTGAFIPTASRSPQVAATQLPGPYRFRTSGSSSKAVYTNTMTVTPYRGCGRPHACFVIERAMDLLAEELGIDRTEIRRRNFIRSDEFPWHGAGSCSPTGCP